MPSIEEYTEVQNGYFELDMNGSDEADGLIAFKTCSGLSYETEIVVSEQNFPNGVRSYKKTPGRINYGDLEFERGLANGHSVLEGFLKAAEMGAPTREDMSLILYNNDMERTVAMKWTLKRAWVSGWSLSDLDAEDDEVLIQTLRVTHEGIVRDG